MSWANYPIIPGLVICEPCALRNFALTLDEFGDEYDETELTTLESAIALVTRLNAADGAEGDDKFAPVPFEPQSGQTCYQCQSVYEGVSA